MTEPCGITGGCLCGAVRFEVRAQPHRVGLCHCLDCRKQHGAPFGALAIFPADRVAFAGDEPGMFASSATGRRYFCRRCGSPVCRGEVHPGDLLAFADAWDAALAASFERLPRVDQPLWELVREKDELRRVAERRAPVASCRLNYFPAPGRPRP